MALELPMIALALSALVALGAGIWLIVHAASVARAFNLPGRGGREVRASRSRGAVWTAIVLFNLGWIAAVAIWSYAASGEANEDIETEQPG